MFRPGTAVLADGRMPVAGGGNANKASVYDPATDSWSATATMNTPRGYQAMPLLSTGEVRSPGAGTGRTLPASRPRPR
ncbi:hypothetical protein ACF1CG_36490 [Streptomyces sp. NPDC014773]|uniref:hypothetical protein n=1 Tax=Streptomyces sp. NPDC014773 TaxID=3364908 RepID=UPI0037025489